MYTVQRLCSEVGLSVQSEMFDRLMSDVEWMTALAPCRRLTFKTDRGASPRSLPLGAVMFQANSIVSLGQEAGVDVFQNRCILTSRRDTGVYALRVWAPPANIHLDKQHAKVHGRPHTDTPATEQVPRLRTYIQHLARAGAVDPVKQQSSRSAGVFM